MKRIVQQVVGLLFLSVISISALQAEEEQSQPWLWVGPRIGITGVISKPADFDTTIQQFFPKSRQYFPLFSEIGVAAEQRIRIGDSGYELFLQERFLVGGLDQTVVLPSLSVLLGFSTSFGLETAFASGPTSHCPSGVNGRPCCPSSAWTGKDLGS